MSTDLSHAAWRCGARAPGRLLRRAILLLAVCPVACVSTPGPAGPTVLVGELPPPSIGANVIAEPAPGATDGPLFLSEPRFSWGHSSTTAAVYAWGCTVNNPSHVDFLVTVVVQLLDNEARPLETGSQEFRLAGGDNKRVSGDGILEGDVAALTTAWRLEYWVKVPPRPPRE